MAEDRGEAVDRDDFYRRVGAAVRDRVSRQIESGVDVVSDGEMSKVGYATYIRHRLSGFEVADVPRATPADLDAYPTFRDRLAQSGATARYLRPVCRQAIGYEDPAPLTRDISTLLGALDDRRLDRAFMNAPSPGVIALFQPNEFYSSPSEYLRAIGSAMKVEYDAIAGAGLVLQIDAPDLAMGRHITYRDRSEEEFLIAARRNVEVLNEALRDVPAEQVRLHICWGNYEGPHHLDVELGKILDVILAADCSTLVFEAANPRHAHEWADWASAKIPEDKVLAPGVIDTTTNFIEHPKLVAERICRFADIVGRDRVVAGTDCGFGTWSGFGAIDPEICWAKLRSLSEGAAIATDRLF